MRSLKIATFGIIGMTVLYSCSSTDNKPTLETKSVNVEIYTPFQKKAGQITLSGEITSRQTATISTRMMGLINKIHVKPGDIVSQGQLLVSIGSDDIVAKRSQIEAMISEAEAAAANAQRDYERFKVLHGQNSVSDKELENVTLQNTSMKAKVQMAHQQLKEVNAMLDYANIRAPFSGIVTQKMMDAGSMANPGMPILMMEQTGDLQVVASVPENHIHAVKVGDSAVVEIKSMSKTIDAKVTELSPSAFRSGGQYSLKLSINTSNDDSIRPGMFVNILLDNDLNSDSKILVEKASIVNRDQLTGVYVVDNNKASLRWVRLGKTVDDKVEVLSGINNSDKIVGKADGKLFNGVTVSVKN